MTDPALDPSRIGELREALDLASPEAPEPGSEPPNAVQAWINAKLAALLHQARRGRNLLRRARHYDPRLMAQLSRDLEHSLAQFDTRFEYLRAEVRALAVWVGADDPTNLGMRVDAIGTNLELLKAELRGIENSIGALGDAIAPGAGLGAVAPRMAELRERLNAVDRRVRQIAASPPAASSTAEPVAGPEAEAEARAATSGGSGSGFDYVGFEQRFRGDSDTVLATSRDRYLDRLRPHQPVLDLGCGRGELLRMLADHGVAGSGVDLDGGMVAEAREAGIDAHHGDAIEYLRNQQEHSFGAITAIHVVEHLPLEALIELLDLAATRLKPGGVFIAETPNPATLLVLGNSYIMDPTHVWPLHPSLLSFLCERAGFRDIELFYGAPADDYRLELLPSEGETAAVAAALNPSLERLNHVLFGPQEYAVIARTPDA